MLATLILFIYRNKSNEKYINFYKWEIPAAINNCQ